MKKHLSLIMAAVVVIFALSCSKGDPGAAGADGTGWMSMSFQKGIYPSPSYAGVYDTLITSGSPTENYSTSVYLYTGYYSSATWHIERSPVQFVISGYIPATATVQKAVLTLYTSNTDPIDTVCYKVNTAWSNTTATWNTPWITPGGDFGAAVSDTRVMTSSSGGNYISWNLTPSEVQSWLTNPSGNYGFMLKSSSEDTGEALFYSSTEATLQYRPKLTVFYTLP
jgi:hypothetical protein